MRSQFANQIDPLVGYNLVDEMLTIEEIGDRLHELRHLAVVQSRQVVDGERQLCGVRPKHDARLLARFQIRACVVIAAIENGEVSAT